MKFEFKSRFDLSVIFTQEIPDDIEPRFRCRVALSLAVKAGVDLAGAYLVDAYLAGAYLKNAYLAGANLAGVDLAGAYLAGVDLAGVDLGGAYLAGANLAGVDLGGAYLAGANLAGVDLAGAYLVDANLAGAYLKNANLAGADLTGADLTGADLTRALKIDQGDIPVIPHIDAVILRAVEAGGVFDMSAWHGPDDHWCGTTHCRAGWAIHEAGEKGKALQDKVGPHMAGAMIYRASRPGKPAPWFFAPTDVALEDLRKCAAEDPLPE